MDKEDWAVLAWIGLPFLLWLIYGLVTGSWSLGGSSTTYDCNLYGCTEEHDWPEQEYDSRYTEPQDDYYDY